MHRGCRITIENYQNTCRYLNCHRTHVKKIEQKVYQDACLKAQLNHQVYYTKVKKYNFINSLVKTNLFIFCSVSHDKFKIDCSKIITKFSEINANQNTCSINQDSFLAGWSEIGIFHLTCYVITDSVLWPFILRIILASNKKKMLYLGGHVQRVVLC